MKLKSYIYSLIASVLLIFSACSPEEFDLGKKTYVSEDLVQGIAYSITHDSENPNIVYLESLLGDSYTPVWIHPQGRSQEKKVTLKMPFNGEYSVTFGVETRGGVVYGAPATFSIADFCADFVTGEMWEYLAGGSGNSKTWVPDNGNYGMKQGFYSCFDPSATYLDMTHNDGKNDWFAQDKTWWEPSNADIGITEDDLKSYMTFSLQGKAGLTVHRFTGGQETVTEGLFGMNTSDHTISAVDVDFIHGEWANNNAVDFKNGFQILVLTENLLMIGNYRDEALSGEGRCVYCWNFVSKEWADNYVVPVDTKEVYPELSDDWRDYVEPKTNKVITYKLSEDTPFGWCNLDGSSKGQTGISALSGIEDITLELNSGTGNYTLTDAAGDSYAGKYTLDNTGVYTFTPALPEIVLSTDGRAVLKTEEGGTLRIMNYETDDYSGALTNFWLGSIEKDDQGKRYQYMGYQFVAQTGGDSGPRFKANLNFFDTGWATLNSDDVFITGDGDYTFTITGANSNPYGLYLDILKILKDYPNMDVAIKDIKVDGVTIEFDDAAISRGYPDDKPESQSARRYILNPWNEASAATTSRYVFTSSIEVIVTVKFDNGTPFIPAE